MIQKLMPRKVDITIQTAATPEQVWRAVTEPEDIASWFSPIVKVEPGVGGSMTFGWDADMQFTSPINAWEPNQHLQTGDDREKNGETFPIRIDYFIESDKGTTHLRLVHSGFGDTADWDNEIAGYEDGWAMFMALIAHRLKHANQPAAQATVYRNVPLPRAEAWAKLAGPDGLIHITDRTFTVNGTQGSVEFTKPNFFRGVIPAWNDAMLAIFCEGGKSSMITVALMVFGDTRNEADARRADWTAALDRFFPAQ